MHAPALVIALLLASVTSAPPVAASVRQAGAPTSTSAAAAVGQPGWRLRWAPQARHDGFRAFEHAEEDRATSHPAGQPHIQVQDNSYRFNMHMVDRDTATDRQRHEVRGMRTFGQTLNQLKGETWRITYSMFIPDTLQATTSFSHIMQTKAPGTGTNPMIVMSLRRHSGVPKIELKVTEGNILVGAVDLAPLQNRWIDIELEMKIGDAPDGSVRWVVRDGATTVIDTTTTGIDNWLFDRVRMKWGIYRSLGDASGSLQDTHMLIRNLRAYQWSDNFLVPSWRYEAEHATIRGGTVESTNGGFSGRGYVNCDAAAGASVEWTVFALRPGPAVLNFWYADATTLNPPMDVTVNGVLAADELAFTRTPFWNDWETRTVIAPLHAGINRIRVTATTAVGGPNLDSLEVRY